MAWSFPRLARYRSVFAVGQTQGDQQTFADGLAFRFAPGQPLKRAPLLSQIGDENER